MENQAGHFTIMASCLTSAAASPLVVYVKSQQRLNNAGQVYTGCEKPVYAAVNFDSFRFKCYQLAMARF